METQPPSQLDTWTFRRVVWSTLTLILVGFAFWLLYRFNQVVFSLFIAILIGTVIRPAVGWLHKRGLPRVAGVMLVYFLFVILLFGFALLLYPLLFEQGTVIVAASPGYYQNLLRWMANNPNQLIFHLSTVLPATLPGMDVIQQSGQGALDSAGQTLVYLASLGKFILLALAIFLLAFHWTVDGPRSIQSLLLLIPQDRRESIADLISAIETKVGYYIIGQSVLCVLIGVMALIAYLLIGLPNALILALIAGILEAVPMIGPLLGAIPAALIALSIAPSKLIWVIVATLVIQQFENSLLVPRIMRRAVGVNPFVSLLSIFAFSSIFGVIGALMAIPIAAILQLLLNRFVFRQGMKDSEVSAGRDYISRLRYDVQELVQDLQKQARIKKEGSDHLIKQTDQVMDEIESITSDLDSLLDKVNPPGEL